MYLEENFSFQKFITESLRANEQQPYKRVIDQVRWISPEKLPYVFHTASQELSVIEPAFCQSFDYKLLNQIIPVTYVLPWPHVNRVRVTSEITGVIRKEGFDQTGIPYTYLQLPNEGLPARIRMGSSMLDQYLLAAKNSGMVFSVYLTEIGQSGFRARIKEFISLANLPVVDTLQFNQPLPFGRGGGGVETHLPLDICRPEFTGFQPFSKYLESLKNIGERIKLIDTANVLLSRLPDQFLHGVFGQLVAQNRQAFINVANNQNRLLMSFDRTK